MTERRPIDRLFLLWWVLASAFSWGLMMFFVAYAPAVVDRIEGFLFGTMIFGGEHDTLLFAFRSAVSGALLGILLGVVIGVPQWLVLRRHIPRSYWWITATVAGFGLGFGASAGIFIVIPDSLFVRIGGLYWNVLQSAAYSLVAALIIGLFQRLVLRHHFGRTWWWLLPSTLASLSVLFWGEVPMRPVFSFVLGAAAYTAVQGLVAGIISGATLLFISRRRKENSK
jgi:hypothetical protein